MACTPQDLATLVKCAALGMAPRQALAVWGAYTCGTPVPPEDGGILTDPGGDVIVIDPGGDVILPD